jgi:hypothetical protein
VPSPPSSSPTTVPRIRSPRSGTSSAAKARTVHSAATNPAFMSHAPRPYTASVPTVPENGT